MKVLFDNLDVKYEKAMKDFLCMHSIALENDGLSIHISQSDNEKLRIEKDKNAVEFKIPSQHLIYRCITLLKEHYHEDNFFVEENCNLNTCGIMIDGSQASSLMTVKSVKKMLLILAGMGYNMLMLYCEDCFDLEGEPYWGNMRPRYSIEDFKEIDSYAEALGIECIPCIQTLGHLTDAIKKQVYREISDTKDILEVGNPAVYELIEKIISQMSTVFKSKRIHIGLDEAWTLGLGNYLRKNGYKPQSEIMKEHFYKVYEICTKYGVIPMMWSDMFFRSKSKIAAYYDKTVDFTDEDRDSIPPQMQLVYWDYYGKNNEHYQAMFDLHKKLTDNIIFAPCVRNVRTFGTHLNTTISTINVGMLESKKAGIKEAFVTVWGDDHKESSNFTLLPGLMWFAEHVYSDTPDEDRVKRRLKYCANVEYDDFAEIDRFDCIESFNGKNENNDNISKICMWQDIMLGLYDKNLEGVDFYSHYNQLEKDMKNLALKYSEHAIMFNFYEKLAAVLKIKASLGIRLSEAYKDNNKDELNKLATVILPELADKVKELRKAHQEYFFNEYKPIGWEILDIRYGGLLMRINTALTRLTDYLEGKIEKIEELAEERLDSKKRLYLDYQDICSASKI